MWAFDLLPPDVVLKPTIGFPLMTMTIGAYVPHVYRAARASRNGTTEVVDPTTHDVCYRRFSTPAGLARDGTEALFDQQHP
jgi:hypothetical protein